jgi:hypothetical protein
MWDFSITISFFEGAGVAALGSTRFEITLAAINPSCSSEDKISSSKLQGSQLPPDVSGMMDSESVDLAEFPVA